MAKVSLSEGFTIIPEGTHVFKITAVSYKEDFGKMEVTMQTQSGQKHVERFSLLKKDGSPNEGALNAFSYFAKTALNDFTLTEIDHEDLLGCFIECDVEHDTQPSNKDPNKTVTFARLTDKRVSDGWEETSAPTTKTAPKTTGKPGVDLKALLG
jgi:hypothetical protein